MFSAPNEQPNVVETVQQNIAAIQQQATAAVTDLNTKVLAAAGAKNNEQLLNSVQQQAQAYATQVKGKKMIVKNWQNSYMFPLQESLIKSTKK